LGTQGVSTFSCPSCHKALEVATGSHMAACTFCHAEVCFVSCPTCGKWFSNEPKKRLWKCTSCGHTYTTATSRVGAGGIAINKICPHCAKPVPMAATTCPYCRKKTSATGRGLHDLNQALSCTSGCCLLTAVAIATLATGAASIAAWSVRR
jgi:ribosomal protein L33